MEQNRNFKGLKRYETLLKTICEFEEYDQLEESEWEGCLGVACVISVIEGVAPNMFSLSKHLDIPHYDLNLQRAFERLRINGVFSNKYNLLKDPALTCRAMPNKMQSGAEVERNAWCIIAGVAGGHCGIRGEVTQIQEEVLKSESEAVTIL